jgi:hypothetical protein
MKAAEAFIFMTMGSAMGILPVLFPSWFPPTGGDESSARALWLEIMAATQVGIGFIFLAQAHALPFMARVVAAVRTSDTGTLALPKARTVSGR